jgi:hypothetical protein
MSFNYITSSSGFTRIAAYAGQLVDGAVNESIEKLSQQLCRSGQPTSEPSVRTQ